ncbi:MAG TPA: hypothetical protein PKJ80_06525 [Candidatus Saccharicenans sp.]|nr:hypothetical protein [Candidatus Saccharicenans sp.]
MLRIILKIRPFQNRKSFTSWGRDTLSLFSALTLSPFILILHSI